MTFLVSTEKARAMLGMSAKSFRKLILTHGIEVVTFPSIRRKGPARGQRRFYRRPDIERLQVLLKP